LSNQKGGAQGLGKVPNGLTGLRKENGREKTYYMNNVNVQKNFCSESKGEKCEAESDPLEKKAGEKKKKAPKAPHKSGR